MRKMRSHLLCLALLCAVPSLATANTNCRDGGDYTACTFDMVDVRQCTLGDGTVHNCKKADGSNVIDGGATPSNGSCFKKSGKEGVFIRIGSSDQKCKAISLLPPANDRCMIHVKRCPFVMKYGATGTPPAGSGNFAVDNDHKVTLNLNGFADDNVLDALFQGSSLAMDASSGKPDKATKQVFNGLPYAFTNVVTSGTTDPDYHAYATQILQKMGTAQKSQTTILIDLTAPQCRKISRANGGDVYGNGQLVSAGLASYKKNAQDPVGDVTRQDCCEGLSSDAPDDGFRLETIQQRFRDYCSLGNVVVKFTKAAGAASYPYASVETKSIKVPTNGQSPGDIEVHYLQGQASAASP